ncbi:ferredoxin reductase family protein [Vibrio sp. Of7-15]|uniref:ferredoxin reductase family protein n=1 Tax=Vibrio sp. Of7-15 TaxID=2724879 RepID=UPI001EF21CD2|nr:ferredoxin reductase family protein [Vibrio sp. Of7-15]MCG7498033.1 ferredoxin reductase family protein [Vibrio sp. Of7-15]
MYTPNRSTSLKTQTPQLIALITVCSGIWFLIPTTYGITQTVSTYFALISMLAMALAMFISTRPKWIEPLLGGMDKAYLWHKWLGIVGLIGVSLHWAIVPGSVGDGDHSFLAESGEDVGELAVNLLLFMGVLSMCRWIPYRWWRYTHRLMGPIFLLCAYHSLFSNGPITLTEPAGLLLIAICALGCTSWLYKTFFYHHRIKPYTATAISSLGSAIEVTLTPQQQPIHHKSGQFAFIDFHLSNSENFHPYTITSSPDKPELTFIIKALGDHTTQLQTAIRQGQTVSVDGAYGRWHATQKTKQPQIWLAAGIGITPFLAWLNESRQFPNEVHLFYSGNGHLSEQIKAKLYALAQNKNITLHIREANAMRLTAKHILTVIKQPLKQYQVFVCGPTSFTAALHTQLKECGLPEHCWHNENFLMR